MCGIVGCIGAYDEALMTKMMDVQVHRGGDSCTIYKDERFYLGHNRLAISDAMNVPKTHSNNEVFIALNGEIYNHNTLRKELKEYDFSTQSDSEVALAAYLKWGETCVEQFNGMFTLVVIDRRTTLSCWIFSDSLGKKPLYYLQNSHGLYFASTIDALKSLSTHNTSSTNRAHYLAYSTLFAPTTWYKDIFALPHDSTLSYIDKGLTVTKRNTWKIKSFDGTQNKDTIIFTIDSLLHQSISTRLTTEVDQGFLLSGGVDSSLVAHIAKAHTNKQLQTFSLGYDDMPQYDERKYARQVAGSLNTQHCEINFSYEDFVHNIDETILALQEPINDPASIPLYVMFKHIKTHTDIKVVLSGEASDELFMGYRPYKELLEIESLATLGKKTWLKNYFNAHPSHHREWQWYSRIFNEKLLFLSSLERFDDAFIQALVPKALETFDRFKTMRPYYEAYESYGISAPSLWYRYVDLVLQQGNYYLKKLDRLSMAHTLEARAPFSDDRLIEYVLSLPQEYMLHENQTKHLLKTVAARYVPQEIVHRKKRGFSYGYLEYMQAMGAFEQIIRLNKTHKLFKQKGLETLLGFAKKGQFKHHVFGVFMMLRYAQLKG